METLGLKDFYEIAFLAYQKDQNVAINKLKSLVEDFPSMLDQDAKDSLMACNKAKKVASALDWPNAPNQSQPQKPARVLASRCIF